MDFYVQPRPPCDNQFHLSLLAERYITFGYNSDAPYLEG